MKEYKIHYRVDTGIDHIEDTAIVKAENKDQAMEKLERYIIRNTGYEYTVDRFYSIDEFTADIFSSKFQIK